jgi:parallel beta-helix repeat protein
MELALATTSFYAPSDLVATPTSLSEVNLSWDDNSDKAAGYEIWRSTDGTNFQKIDTVGADEENYDDSLLVNGTRLNVVRIWYEVRGFRDNDTVFTGFSNQALAHWTLAVDSTGNSQDANPNDGTGYTGDLNDAGVPECTLKAAIKWANDTPGVQDIYFDIPDDYANGDGVFVIDISGGLEITHPVNIWGNSEPGYANNGGKPMIFLSGGNLTISGGDSTVSSLGFLDGGIILSGTGGNTIEHCYIGVGADGTPDGNGGPGILIDDSSDNHITSSVISGNDVGVKIAGGGDNTIQHCIVGL